MSRYIDAEALIVELQKDEERFDKEAEDAKDDASYTECYSDAMWSRANGIRDAIVEVYDAPHIDIVRCKECKHSEYREDFDDYECHSSGCGLVYDADFFCADGEREGE